jgi:anti-anti-sigma factor
MKIVTVVFADGMKKIMLSGRMDFDGVDKIDLPLSAAAASERGNVVIDLSGVEFMSSIGIGALVKVAKAQKLRGGKVILMNPQPIVDLVLKRTLIDQVVPIVQNLEAARHIFLS